MWFKILCVSLLLVVYSDAETTLRKEAYMTVPQLIKSNGYPCEKHRVTTEDDYTLQMHRIPAGRRSARRSEYSKGKKAVLVVHGLTGHSGDFVLLGPERSLGYLLADSGYDVWLGNLRGTVYSAHKNLTKNNPKFWEFSIHEHGKYDLPAMIDGIRNITGLQKVMYIGHSMGTTSFFTMMAQKPEYNEKIVAFVALAPAVFLNNMRGISNMFLTHLNIMAAFRAQRMWSIQPVQFQELLTALCYPQRPQTDPCTNFIFSIVGEDFEQNDPDMMMTYIYRAQPGSLQQLEHFGKIAITGVFTTWDGSMSAPVRPYNLTNVKVPVLLMYGENDKITEKSEIMRLAEVLNSTGALEDVMPACSWPKFNHLDFIFAKDVGILFNKPLIKHVDRLFQKYNEL